LAAANTWREVRECIVGLSGAFARFRSTFGSYLASSDLGVGQTHGEFRAGES